MRDVTNRALALAIAVGIGWASAGVVSAQLSSRDAACRYKVAQAARNYSAFVVERALLCHKKRARGSLPAAIECNDPSTWAANGFDRGAYLHSKDRSELARKVAGCRPDATLAALGYASCPAPCDALPVGTLDELSNCMLCLADDCMLDAVQSVYGTTPLPATKAAGKCVERAGRHLESYYNARTFMQQKCQMKKDKGYANWTGVPDCGDLDDPAHPFFAKNAAYRAKRENVLQRRCANVDVAAETGTCGTDAATLAACATAAAESCSNSLFPQVFP